MKFGLKKLETLLYRMVLYCDRRLSHFDTIHVFDRHRDGQTDRCRQQERGVPLKTSKQKICDDDKGREGEAIVEKGI